MVHGTCDNLLGRKGANPMRKSRYSEEQIIAILRRSDSNVHVTIARFVVSKLAFTDAPILAIEIIEPNSQ
jgi:hypothetical protein